jgi:hypothetical protein
VIAGRPLTPREVPLLPGGQTLHEVELGAVPSTEWRAAFLRPARRLVSMRFTPDLGRVGVAGSEIHFRTAPDQLDAWLYRIDGWIDYVNSVVAE